jgi:2-succinyl-6-hydroxy-2,4-cyclohexadiene-1-carboxylate synthase
VNFSFSPLTPHNSLFVMPILALHGFTGRGSDFAPVAKLCGGDWRCPDLPGHGAQPQLDCSPAAMVNFLNVEATLLSLSESNLKKSDKSVASTSILLGYSMGARAALLHAVAHPDAWDALILISPNPGIEDPSEHPKGISRAERLATDAKLADRIEHDGAAAFIEFWQQTPMIRSQQSISPEWRETMQDARKSHSAEGLATSLRQFGQGSCPNLWPELPKLTMPICLITGAQDHKYTQIAETFAIRHPSSAIQAAVIDGAGHMPHLEAPEATSEIVRTFLEEI